MALLSHCGAVLFECLCDAVWSWLKCLLMTFAEYLWNLSEIFQSWESGVFGRFWALLADGTNRRFHRPPFLGWKKILKLRNNFKVSHIHIKLKHFTRKYIKYPIKINHQLLENKSSRFFFAKLRNKAQQFN